MNIARLEKLFEEYEKSFATLDLLPIARKYADSFISAGPKGSAVQHRADFELYAGQAAEYYRSIGQSSARLISKEILHISNEYCLVTVHWGVTYSKTADELIQFDVSYLVQEQGEELKIILFISHEDEEEVIKKLGLVAAPVN